MKNALENLPQHKRDELGVIKDIIREKILDVRMIILFGSYARGEWVEDTHIEGHITHVYESDFDILVATKTKKQANNWDLHSKINEAIQETGKVETPVSIIYHTFDEVKERITEGHYFFSDIKKEGIHLHRGGRYSLGKIKVLSPQERKKLAKEYFDNWFKSAKNFYHTFEFNLKEQMYKEAAFQLHQATERFYGALTLVFVNYRYRSHDLNFLRRKAISYNSDFAKAFPMETKDQRDNFDLLKRAYIDSRYKKDYEITEDQLQYLAQRVQVLMGLTEIICQQKIQSFV